MQHLNKARQREIVVNVGGEFSRATVFAVPVVMLDPQGLGLRLDDLDGVALSDLLKLRSGLNVQGQCVHVLPLLFSPQVLANLTSRETERDFAARMIEDCLREQFKGESLMARRLASITDGEAQMPLRFVIGCVFQDDLDHPVESAVDERWHSERLWAQAEACIRTERCAERARAVVLPPMAVQESLDEGLAELARQVFATAQGGAQLDVRFIDDDDVEVSVSAQDWATGTTPRELKLILSAKLLGRERIEDILKRAQLSLGSHRASRSDVEVPALH